MTTSYITLGSKNIQVVWESWKPAVQPIETVRDTLTGKTVKNFGRYKRQWAFTGLFVLSSPTTGYAAYSDIETMYTTTTATNKVITLTDFAGTTASVVTVGNFSPKCLSLDPTVSTSVWQADITLRESP